MEPRSAFIIQIFEKLGKPLISSVIDVAARQSAGEQAPDKDKKDAERVAELLSKSVQLSIAMTNMMEIKDTGPSADSVRLALASLASPLIAEHYRLSGKVPNDGDIKRIVSALESILTFSDNFAPLAESIKRLSYMDPDVATIADESQTQIQYIVAMTPLIHAAARFSFGRSEQKLVLEVSHELMKRADLIAKSMLNDTEDNPALKQATIQCLRALVDIYVISHDQETKKLMAMSEDQRLAAAGANGNIDMKPVWDRFESMAGMLEALSKSIAPGTGASSGGAAPKAEAPAAAPAEEPVAAAPPPPPPSPPPVQEEAPAAPVEQAPPAPAVPEQPPTAPPAETPPAPAEPETPAEQPAPAQDASYNPMGFFKKPDDEEGGTAAPSPAEPAEEPATATPPPPPPPVQEEPPAAPVEQAPPAPAVPEQQAEAQAQAQPEPEGQPEEKSGNYNPMGFFAKKPSEADDSGDETA